MGVVKNSLLIAVILLASCSDNKTSGGDDSPGPGNANNIHFFKATGGQHHFITPLVGVRLYDNNAFIYVAVRECETTEKDGAIKRISVSWSGKSVAEEPKIGGIGQWNNQCSFDANFLWEKNTLKVKGPFLRVENALDIEMTRITKDEFFTGLKAITTDKGMDYRILPRDERENFDQTCKDLAGAANCDSLLK